MDRDQPTPIDDLPDKPSQAEGAPGDDDITAGDQQDAAEDAE
jgi:hypothetical protein